MPDYNNGKIYQLIFGDRPERYIGSTTRELHQRLSGHRSTKTHKNVKTLVDIVGRMNVKIVLIEDYPCPDKNELLKREQCWIDELKPVLNTCPAYSTCCVRDEKTLEQLINENELRIKIKKQNIKRREQKLKDNERMKIENARREIENEELDIKFEQWRIDTQSPHKYPSMYEKNKFIRLNNGKEYLNKWNDHGCHMLSDEYGEPHDIKMWCNNWDTCPYNIKNQ